MERIIKNCIRCRSCGDIIESKSRHDFVTCSCGNVAVDGGHDYLRRVCRNGPRDIEELSIVETDDEEDDDANAVEYY